MAIATMGEPDDASSCGATSLSASAAAPPTPTRLALKPKGAAGASASSCKLLRPMADKDEEATTVRKKRRELKGDDMVWFFRKGLLQSLLLVGKEERLRFVR